MKTRNEPMGRPYQTKEFKAAAKQRRKLIPPLHAAGLSTRQIAAQLFETEDPTPSQIETARNDMRWLMLIPNKSSWTPDDIVKNIVPPRQPRVPVLLLDDAGPCWDAVDDMGFSCCQACRGHGEVPRVDAKNDNDKRKCSACAGAGWKRSPSTEARVPAAAFARIGCALGNVMVCGLD